MALLAEPKRKVKFGLDPRNTNWSNDDNKIGQRLMEKMGWEKGKGLGANEDGMKEHIKASYKSDCRGLGFTAKDADAWIAHQEDFNELLKTLNSTNGPEESKEQSKEEQRPPDGQKRYRGRFARGSVQTLRSVEDLDCIFGKRKSKSNNNSDSEAEEHKHGLTSVTSTTSVQDYFAKKMAEMKARKESSVKVGEEVKTDQTSVPEKEQLEKRVPPVYGAVMFSYDENGPDTKACDDAVEGSDKKCERGWYQEWPGENKTETGEKTKKKKKDKNSLKDLNLIETEVATETIEPEGEVTVATKKRKKLKKQKREKIDSIDSGEEQSNGNISRPGIDNNDDNIQVGELNETRKSFKSTKKSKKNKTTEKDDENPAKRKKDQDDELADGQELSKCVEGEETCDKEQGDLKRSKKSKRKKEVLDEVDSTEARQKSKRKRDNSNTTDLVTEANQEACSESTDVDKSEKKKRKQSNQSQPCSEDKPVDNLIAERQVEPKKSKKRKHEDSEVDDVKVQGSRSSVDQPCEADNQLVDQIDNNSKMERARRKERKKRKLIRKKLEMEKIKKQKEAENSIFPGSNVADITGYAMAGKVKPLLINQKKGKMKKEP